MARIFVDGFETGNCQQWSGFTSSVGVSPWTVVTSQKHSGSYSLECSETFWAYWYKYFNITDGIINGSFWVRWKYYSGTYGSEGFFPISDLFTFYGITAPQVALSFSNDTGKLNAMRGDVYGTFLGSSEKWIFTPEVWHCIQFKIAVHLSDGIFQVWLDGNPTPVIDITGANTRGDTNIEIRRFDLGFRGRTNGTVTVWIDDIVLDDSVVPNPARVIRMPLESNGDLHQCIPSVGENYQCVDEVPYSDTDYISSDISEVTDIYNISDLVPGVSINIKSVSEQIRAYASGGPSLLRVLPIIYDGATVNIQSDSSEILAFTPTIISTRVWEINPFTNLPFTLSELNALQFGVKVTEFYRSFNTLSSNQSLNLSVWPFGLTAFWDFESDTLTWDSLGRNNLTASESSPTAFTDYFKSGSACANFTNSSSQYFYINDEDLSDDFPLKSSDTIKQITVMCWINLDSAGGGGGKLWSKGNTFAAHYGINCFVAGNLLWLGFSVGTLGAESSHAMGTSISIAYGQWYHVALAVDGISKSIYVRVYQDSTDTVYTYSNTLNDELVLNSHPFMIGCESSLDPLFFCDGKIDGVKVLNRCLGADEIDFLRY